jgi:Ca2+-binding RTX toxin-like protein
MAKVHGTNGNDFLFDPWGLNGNDTIYGYAGDDTIYGLGGNDVIFGGAGADEIHGGAGEDTASYSDSPEAVWINLSFGQGNGGYAEGDTLDGIEDLTGSSYADHLAGNDGTNVLQGGYGNDVLEGGAGADRLDGGAGDRDLADYQHSPTGVVVLLYTDTAAGGDAEGDELGNIEGIIGSNYHDDLWGDDGGNLLWGIAGDDTLKGFGGADTLIGFTGRDQLYGMDGDDALLGDWLDDYLNGGAGEDFLNGGTGADTMLGGTGDDRYIVDDAGDTVIEFAGEGSDTVRTSISWAIAAGAEIETLRTDDDDGVSTINLTGNASGNDIYGNDGNNILNGGDGSDRLTGLDGADSFLFTTVLNAASNVDVIADFDVTDDTIVLNAAVFSGIGLGAVAESRFVIGAAAQDAGHRIIYNDATGAVYYDSDGTGAAAAIQFAALSPGLALTNHDFYVNFYF